jgi:hypothetical protein
VDVDDAWLTDWPFGAHANDDPTAAAAAAARARLTRTDGQEDDLLYPSCPRRLELPFDLAAFDGLVALLDLGGGDASSSSSAAAAAYSGVYYSDALVAAATKNVAFRVVAGEAVFAASFAVSALVVALGLVLFWDYQVMRAQFELAPVLPEPRSAVSVLFAQPAGSPLLAGAAANVGGTIVCDSCCMVCCRSRHPLRRGPLQRANEVAVVTDVDIDKRLVCVAA